MFRSVINLILLAACAGIASADGFRVLGRFDYEYFDLQTGVAHSAPAFSRLFEADVSDAGWTIQAKTEHAGGTPFVSLQYSYDGTNLVKTEVLDTANAKWVGGAPPADFEMATLITNRVTVMDHEMPYLDTDFIGAVWMTYAASSQLGSPTGEKLVGELVLFSKIEESLRRNRQLQCATTRWSLNTNFFQRIEFRNTTGTDLRAKRTQSGAEWIEYKHPPPHDKGYLSAVLTVSGALHGNGLTIPKESVLTVFKTKPNGEQASDLREMARIKVQANTVSLLEETNGVFGVASVAKRSKVVDRRMPIGQTHVSYKTDTGYVPTNTAAYSNAIEEAKSRDRLVAAERFASKWKSGEGTRNARFMFWLFLAGSLALFLFIFHRTRPH